MKILILDIETSGLPPKNAHYETDFDSFPRVVSLAWKVDDGPAVEYIINQEGFKIPEESINIHGITNEMAEASEHKIEDVVKLLLKEGAGADKVVGHGIYFDTSTIKANILRINKGDLGNEMFKEITELFHKDKRIDTMRSTTKFCALPMPFGRGGFKWPKLEELYRKLFNEDFNAHNSKDDVSATHRCLRKLLELKVIEL